MQSPFLLNNALDVHHIVPLMVPRSFVVLMDVEILVELALLDRNVVGATAHVLLTAVVDNAVMMVVGETHVDLVLMVKPAKMVSVSVLVLEPVGPESAVMIELEAPVDHALWDKDVEVEFVSATMTVTKETVEQQLLMPDPSVPLKAVVHAPLDSPAVPQDNALLLLLVMLTLWLLIKSAMLLSQDNVHLVSVDRPIPLIPKMDSFGLPHLLPGMLRVASVVTCSVLAVLDMQSIMRLSQFPQPLQLFFSMFFPDPFQSRFTSLEISVSS